MTNSANYRSIVDHYESCLTEHGDTCRGVDWPNAQQATTRYSVMLDVIRDHSGPTSVLDVGCGAGHLLEHLLQQDLPQIEYTGLDLSAKFVNLCRKKFPKNSFYCMDLLADETLWNAVPHADYAIMNGVFTERRSVPWESMLEYMLHFLTKVFGKVRKGMAFNVMSKHVDWERDDLFHVSYDVMAARLRSDISRHCIFRADYGLYEYTVYVYHQPR